MFFRFASALILVVSVSLAGVALEKSNLVLRRAISQQHYQLDALLEEYARLRLETQRMAAPSRLVHSPDSAVELLRNVELDEARLR